jgi:hypothetical protein
MRQWLKRAVLVCGVFIAIWIGMAMYWNASNRLPTLSDVIIYLGVAPIGLVFALWLSVKMVTALTVKPAVGTSTGEAEKVDSTTSSSEKEAIRTELIILASSIKGPHGESTDELAQALISNNAKLVLDEKLTDSNGYPILSGRIQAVEEEAQREMLSEWMSAHQFPEISWSSEQLRALAIGSTTFLDLLQHVMTHPLLPAYTSATPAQRPSIALPTLQLLSVLPLHWGEDHRFIATKWFNHLIEQQGWPQEGISLRQASSTDYAQPYLMIEQLSFQAHHQALPCFSLLISCESYIGEQTVLEWENAGKLLTTSREIGQVPSEGAAGFLFADAKQANLMEIDGQAKIHRMFQARREKSADVRGRIDTEVLSGLTQKALAVAGISPEKVELLTADTDHRTSRTGELIGMAYTTFPDLDLKTQCYKVAATCGFTGAVSSLTALALAHHAAVSHGSEALCISNQDEFQCSAVLVSPMRDESAALDALA